MSVPSCFHWGWGSRVAWFSEGGGVRFIAGRALGSPRMSGA
ncbi:MAG: hypothetical protein RI897_1832 [Verrucomicrobiota bacterium]